MNYTSFNDASLLFVNFIYACGTRYEQVPVMSSKSELRSFRLRSGENGFRYGIQESRLTLHPHKLYPRRIRESRKIGTVAGINA